MNYKSLIQAVYKTVSTLDLSDRDVETANIDRIMIGAFLYNVVSSLAAKDNSVTSNISSFVGSYSSNMKSLVDSMKYTYTSYKALNRQIKDYNLSSFLEITPSQISKLMEIYQKRSEIVPFNVFEFSPSMYNIMSLTTEQYNRMYNVHMLVIVPLVKHYMAANSIREADVSVEDYHIKNPGKQIRLSISGIKSSKIVSDVMFNKVNIKKYIHSCSLTSDGYVDLVLK